MGIKTLLCRPEFYDIFGFFIFVFIIAACAWSLTTGNELSETLTSILLVIGIAGLIVDGSMVYSKFLS